MNLKYDFNYIIKIEIVDGFDIMCFCYIYDNELQSYKCLYGVKFLNVIFNFIFFGIEDFCLLFKN